MITKERICKLVKYMKYAFSIAFIFLVIFGIYLYDDVNLNLSTPQKVMYIALFIWVVYSLLATVEDGKGLSLYIVMYSLISLMSIESIILLYQILYHSFLFHIISLALGVIAFMTGAISASIYDGMFPPSSAGIH